MRIILLPRLFRRHRPDLTPIPQRVEELMSRIEIPLRVWCRSVAVRYQLHEQVEALLVEDLLALSREVLRWGLRVSRRFL